MASHKIKRAEEDIKREISSIIPELKDPRITGMISIVGLTLSPDYSYCTLYISSLEGFAHASEAAEGLNSASGFIRRQISNRLELRRIPTLTFVADDSIAYSANIGKIIYDLKKDGKVSPQEEHAQEPEESEHEE